MGKQRYTSDAHGQRTIRYSGLLTYKLLHGSQFRLSVDAHGFVRVINNFMASPIVVLPQGTLPICWIKNGPGGGLRGQAECAGAQSRRVAQG